MIVRLQARELIAGIADDPTFGPVIVFGCGGTAVEVIDDKALALPPLDMKLATDLVRRTRISRTLKAYRNVPAVKEPDVAVVLVNRDCTDRAKIQRPRASAIRSAALSRGMGEKARTRRWRKIVGASGSAG